MDEPEFAAPIVEAMDNTLPVFHVFKYFPLFRKSILAIPPWLSLKISPQMAGLSHLQILLGKQVNEVIANPDSLKDASHPIIYHRLLDPDAHKDKQIPDATALYEEAQSLVFAGGVTVADTLMTGHFHILSQPLLYAQLQAEVLKAWPDIDSPPRFEALETLPLLTATIKESLRHSPGVASPLLRVVPASGATISGRAVPGGAIVGMSATIVHKAPSVFADPDDFIPARWQGRDGAGLDRYLVSFGKGPRSCLGINLAWCELYIGFATMLRRFDMELDGTTEEDLVWRDCFTPYYPGRHLRAWCRPRVE
jgi:cytochrome P450